MVKCNSKDTDSSCRSYKIAWSEIGFKSPTGSYYKGKTPSAAAKKMGTRLFSMLSKPEYAKFKGMTTIKLTVREATRGAGGNAFFFKATRVKLPSPITRVYPNGSEVTITHKTEVKRCGTDFK